MLTLEDLDAPASFVDLRDVSVDVKCLSLLRKPSSLQFAVGNPLDLPLLTTFFCDLLRLKGVRLRKLFDFVGLTGELRLEDISSVVAFCQKGVVERVSFLLDLGEASTNGFEDFDLRKGVLERLEVSVDVSITLLVPSRD
mgnify:CR=1 FL=1